MQRVLESLPAEARVAVLRLRSLGDCVLTTPALDLLRRARPDLRIAVVVEPRFRAIFENNPDITAILPPQPAAVHRWRPALCLNLHGGSRSAAITALSGARWRAAFAYFRYRLLYNLHIPRAQEILGVERKVHTAEHLASAMFYLGAPRRDVPRARLIAAPRPAPPGNLAIIHPVAANPRKTWPAEGFLAVADHLKTSGIEPFFIGAAADDLAAFQKFRVVRGAPLAEIKNLLASASLFVGNDSGPAHMAAAFGLPSVVIFSASDPEIWGPWRTNAEVVRAPASATTVLDAVARLRVSA